MNMVDGGEFIVFLVRLFFLLGFVLFLELYRIFTFFFFYGYFFNIVGSVMFLLFFILNVGIKVWEDGLEGV